ncbi:MAG: hypothetical protein HPAVJP_4650 [Candidatus Hepatoplasma vulgare]|nr:MAG: hypothetical protein HPAVJP_4650 [Candidatus Hepatoplasma sp.]
MKTITFLIISFTFGYLVGSEKEKDFKKTLENVFSIYDNLKSKTQESIYKALANLEEIDVNELKINIDKIFLIIKERLEKFWELETVEERISYSKKQISEIKNISKEMFKKYKD